MILTFLSKIQDTAQVPPRDVSAPLASHSCAADANAHCQALSSTRKYQVRTVFLGSLGCLHRSSPPRFRRGPGNVGWSVSASPCGLQDWVYKGAMISDPFLFRLLWTLGTRRRGRPPLKKATVAMLCYAMLLLPAWRF